MKFKNKTEIAIIQRVSGRASEAQLMDNKCRQYGCKAIQSMVHWLLMTGLTDGWAGALYTFSSNAV